MSVVATRNTLFDRFKAQWDAGAYSAVTVAWPNKKFTPPDNASFVRVLYFPVAARQASLAGTSNRLWRHTGLVTVECFAPIDDDTEDALGMADHVVSIFRGQTLSGVRCRAPEPNVIGPQGSFYQVNVSTPIEYNDVA
jgi:hypothetical protein